MLLFVPPLAIFAAIYAALHEVKRGVQPPRAVLRHVITLAVTFTSLRDAVRRGIGPNRRRAGR